MHPKLIARDLIIAGLMVGLVTAALAADVGASAHVVLSIVAAVLVGLCGHLLHEYGHLVASLLSRSQVRFPTRLSAPLVFDFEVAVNSRRQFLIMSTGGYLGSLLAVALIATLLPRMPRGPATATTGTAAAAPCSRSRPPTMACIRGSRLATGPRSRRSSCATKMARNRC